VGQPLPPAGPEEGSGVHQPIDVATTASSSFNLSPTPNVVLVNSSGGAGVPDKRLPLLYDPISYQTNMECLVLLVNSSEANFQLLLKESAPLFVLLSDRVYRGAAKRVLLTQPGTSSVRNFLSFLENPPLGGFFLRMEILRILFRLLRKFGRAQSDVFRRVGTLQALLATLSGLNAARVDPSSAATRALEARADQAMERRMQDWTDSESEDEAEAPTTAHPSQTPLPRKVGFPRLRRICKPKDSTRLNPSNLHPPSTPLADFHLGTASPSTLPSPPASDLLDFPSFVRGVVYVLAQSMVEYPPNRVFLQDSDGSSRNVSALAACVLGALADLQSHSQDAVARPRPAASNTNLPQSPQGMVAPVADGPSGAADSGDGIAANIRLDEATSPGEDSLLKVVMPTKSEGGRGAPAPATSSAQDGACGSGVGESEWGMLETRAWELMLALFRLACPDETWSLINKGAVDVLLRALPSCPLLVQHRGFTRLLHFLDPSLPSVASNLELLCRGGLLMQVFRAYEAILRDETHSLRIILLKLVERVAGFRVRGVELRAIQELLGSDFPEFFLRMHTFSQSFGGCAPAIEFRVSRLNYACLHIAPFDHTVSSVPGGACVGVPATLRALSRPGTR